MDRFTAITICSLSLGICQVGTSDHFGKSRGDSSFRLASGTRVSYRSKPSRRRKPLTLIEEPSEITSNASVKKHRFEGLVVQLASGLNAGFASTNGPQNGTTRNALAFSLMFEKQLSSTFYLCPEISYVQRGVQTNLFSLSGIQVTGNVSLNTLEIPLLIKAKFSLDSARKVRFFLVGGPWAGLVLTRQVEILGLINGDLSARFGQFDAGLVVGSGIEYQINPDLAVVGHLRNAFGIINLDNSGTTFYTRGIQFLLGAQFKL
jgi:hypothetical protein